MPTIPALRKQTGSFLSLRAVWSTFTASIRLGLHGDPVPKQKTHTKSCQGRLQRWVGGWQASWRYQKRPNGLVSSPAAYYCQQPRFCATLWLWTFHEQARHSGCWRHLIKHTKFIWRCVALLPTSSELWSCSVEPMTSRSQNSSRKGQTNIQPH